MRRIVGSSHVGLVRSSNQDRFEILEMSEDLGAAVLCDGMGGKNGGGEAAALAVESAKLCFQRSLQAGFSRNIEETSVRNLFTTIFSAANAIVHDTAKENEELDGMGTTMVLALLYQDSLYIGWVGDSRAYLCSAQEEAQLTKDHSVVQLMVDKQEITKTEALNHPQKHFITRAIGVADEVEFDFLVRTITAEDIVLLCSDGPYAYLNPGELFPIAKSCLEQQTAEPLVDLALSRGGADNITAVIMV